MLHASTSWVAEANCPGGQSIVKQAKIRAVSAEQMSWRLLGGILPRHFNSEGMYKLSIPAAPLVHLTNYDSERRLG